MKRNTPYLLALSLTGILGLGVGLAAPQLTSLVTPPVEAQTSQSQKSVPTLNKLNEDFIAISETVTPAVVSISMSKTLKAPSRSHPQVPEEFEEFFGAPFPAPRGEQKQQGVGSGVIVDAAKGYILTNNHVVADADEIKVTLSDRRTFKAKIIGTDPRTDLAVIQVSGAKGLRQASLGDSKDLEVGEWVLAIGNPFGLSSTVTAGIISAKGRANVGVADFEDFIQTDAAINPGNSGGALVNIKGELIGINTAIATRSKGYMGIGFAIPSNMAKQVMQSLINKGKVSRAQLGVFIQPLDDSMAQGLGLKDSREGILVSGVVNGSPADKAGIKKYDVILKLNGKSINDSNQFRNQVAMTPSGSSVEIEILRNGKTMTFKPLLREMENTGKAAENMQTPALQDKRGFQLQDLNPTLRQQLQVPPALQGVVVTDVSPSSQAYEKGLREGDLITEINRAPVRSLAQFNAEFNKLKSGDVALLAVQREQASVVIAFEIP
ncbi:MAG: DegQ family serine endoprotease [Candidatus Sericytochromatia bacterium]|nr:DegQ family serine endoprotease [Candidatus Sericytochromatia bacterium]